MAATFGLVIEPRSEQPDPSHPGRGGEYGRVDLHRGDAYGLSFADVYDSWYEGVTDAEATARFVDRRCGERALIELGVGSGRLARPLARLGAIVIGLDASGDMLAQARQIDAESAESTSQASAIYLVRADMRALPFRGPVGGALIAFNTLFNLSSEDEQRDLLSQIRSLLADDGVLIIEALDLSMLLDGPASSIGIRTASEDGLVVTATQLDRNEQTLQGQHLQIDDRGVSIRPWRLRWLTPTQLDQVATAAGLALAERYGGWDEEPFTETSETHISVYRPIRTR